MKLDETELLPDEKEEPVKAPWYISGPFRLIPDYSRKTDRVGVHILAISGMLQVAAWIYSIIVFWYYTIKCAGRLVSLIEETKKFELERLCPHSDAILAKVHVWTELMSSHLRIYFDTINLISLVLLLCIFMFRKKTLKDWKVLLVILGISGSAFTLLALVGHFLILKGARIPVVSLSQYDEWITHMFFVKAGMSLISITLAVLIFHNSRLLWKDASERVRYRGFFGWHGYLCWGEERRQPASRE